MADKITNFEDYKKKDNVPGDTTDIDIQIEDPVNFFNAQEREEFFQERQKEQARQQAPVQNPVPPQPPVQPNPYAQQPVQQNPYVQQPMQQQYSQNDYSQLVNNAWNQNGAANQNYDPQYDDEEYDEDYEDDYYEEDEEEEGGFPIELFVRISSIITGIIILAFLAIVAKVKIYDRYFAPDPDEEQVTVAELPLPSGYTEKAGTVVVTAEQLNLRTVDNSQSSDTVVTAVPKGTELKRIAVNSDESWALVEYNGQRVYASMKYLSEK